MKKAAKGQSLRFTLVDIQNWRNFTRARVPLRERVFLVGPNASAKSNFLDVFRYLHDVVSVGGGFREATGSRGTDPTGEGGAARAQSLKRALRCLERLLQRSA